MKFQNLVLEGKYVKLEEIQPKFFKYVVEWRNNPDLNKYIVQPFVLTEELEQKWYDKYLEEDGHGLMIMIAKDTNEPFGTLGWIYYEPQKKQLVGTHLLIGNSKYFGSKEYLEAALLISDYEYDVLGVNVIYGHVIVENKKVYSLNKKFGYKNVLTEPQYIKKFDFLGQSAIEMYRTKEMYLDAKSKLVKLLK